MCNIGPHPLTGRTWCKNEKTAPWHAKLALAAASSYKIEKDPWGRFRNTNICDMRWLVLHGASSRPPVRALLLRGGEMGRLHAAKRLLRGRKISGSTTCNK